MSILGSLVSPLHGNTISTTVVRSIGFSPRHSRAIRRRNAHQSTNSFVQQSKVIKTPAVTSEDLERIFINSLVAASSCSLHQNTSNVQRGSLKRPTSNRSDQKELSTLQRRGFSSGPRKKSVIQLASEPDEIEKARRAIPRITPEEYKELVNTYAGFGGKVRNNERASKNKAYFPLAPRLFMTPEQEDAYALHGRNHLLQPRDAETRQRLKFLRRLLARPLGGVSQEELWQAYENLPEHRPRYLNDASIQRMFRHLAWVEFRTTTNAMQRYLAFLNHCSEEGLELNADIWNTAISFSARWIRRTSTAEFKAAVETWMRMEEAGFEPTNVTFNILFDVAIRAGRYGLADTIFQELVTRKMPLNRFFRTSVIFYAGLQKNGDNVRSAFRDLVSSGEIVDTAVMNCVMLSLIRAGEGAAAENVFGKMKALHEEKFGIAGPQSWQAQKRLGRFLDHTARALREERNTMQNSFFGTAFSNEDRKEAIQNATPLAPNARTYRILIAYHAETSGDLDRIRDLMAEMSDRGLAIHGSAYFLCLKGFIAHGGIHRWRSSWCHMALEELWADFIAAAAASSSSVPTTTADLDTDPARPSRTVVPTEILKDASSDLTSSDHDHLHLVPDNKLSEESRAPYFTVALTCVALRAFHRCAGRRRMLQVWQEIQSQLWQGMTMDQRLEVQETVDSLRS
jgi:pentatricopeptide repeat protein